MAFINKTIRFSEVSRKLRIDSEYFTPDFVKAEEILVNLKCGYSSLNRIAYITDGDHSTRKYVSQGIKFLTSENISEFEIDYETTRFIDPVYEKSLLRSRSEKDAIYLSKTGRYYGKAAICINELPIFNIPADVGKIRVIKPEKIDPYFLCAFLNTNLGNLLIRRENSGGSRDRITLVNIGKIPVPFIRDEEVQIRIKKYLENNETARSLYKQATELLEQELGLDTIKFQNTKSFNAKFSEVATSIRLDAGHYQPKFEQLIVHLKNHFETRKISYLASCNRRGLQPNYDPQGEIDVINSKHITTTHLKYDEFEKTTLADYKRSVAAQIQKGDILIYTTGAYVGLTNVYLSDKPALASNHVNILRIKDSEIDPAYIGLVLNTTVGKFQTEQHIRGSAQVELYPNDIAKFIVPLLSKSTMQKIGNLVRDSLIYSDQSKQLLAQAKARVEHLIEESANR